MGLILKGNKYAMLTDIQGLEDALGEMDFKVAGTKEGITAIQMDIKVQGITIDIMREAMDEAQEVAPLHHRQARRNDRGPRAELSQFAPRMIVIKIDPGEDQRRHRSRRQDHQQDHCRHRRREDRHRGRRQRLHHVARRRVRRQGERDRREYHARSDGRRDVQRHRRADHPHRRVRCRFFPARKASCISASSRRTRVEKVEDVVKLGDEVDGEGHGDRRPGPHQSLA